MTEHTPSQAEGEPEPTTAANGEPETTGHRDAPRTTPSQAEGDEDDEDGEDDEDADSTGTGTGSRTDDAEWEAGWSGP
ncbi:hypothetical protein AB0K92_20930 [Streptomyces sp. NPDC052687]|uniref:hypothetical protein n=1 Tax=Streptomyces sp. NPDC052687 TaxID=3154759 RepID=UPI0034376F10